MFFSFDNMSNTKIQQRRWNNWRCWRCWCLLFGFLPLFLFGFFGFLCGLFICSLIFFGGRISSRSFKSFTCFWLIPCYLICFGFFRFFNLITREKKKDVIFENKNFLKTNEKFHTLGASKSIFIVFKPLLGPDSEAAVFWIQSNQRVKFGNSNRSLEDNSFCNNKKF